MNVWFHGICQLLHTRSHRSDRLNVLLEALMFQPHEVVDSAVIIEIKEGALRRDVTDFHGEITPSRRGEAKSCLPSVGRRDQVKSLTGDQISRDVVDRGRRQTGLAG